MKEDIKGLSNVNKQGNRTSESSKELEKLKTQIIVEIIEYAPDSVVTKTIIKKKTGNIAVSSVDQGKELAEKKIALRHLHSNN